MTTAARPTWDTARGGSSRGEKNLSSLSKQYSSRDLPGHTKLKYRYVCSDNLFQSIVTNITLLIVSFLRQSGQNATSDVKKRDLRKELEEKEKGEDGGSKRSSGNSDTSSGKKFRSDQPAAAIEDDRDEEVYANDSSDDDSDEDDTAELLAELNRIKRERAAEEAKKDAEKKVQDERIRMENILSGNPLIGAAKTDFKVKRRWDDDVVFKNCARNEPDKSKPSFINDTLRSEFHKKFMEKYVK